MKTPKLILSIILIYLSEVWTIGIIEHNAHIVMLIFAILIGVVGVFMFVWSFTTSKPKIVQRDIVQRSDEELMSNLFKPFITKI